jgi:CRP-like cAMP-binding protein
MSVNGGMFNIIQRAQFNALSVRHTVTTMPDAGGSTNPLTWSLRKSESAIQAYWRLAPEQAARNAPSADLVQRLEKLADGGNKDIAVEKLRQAKARLAALRQQLQLAAASGDTRQIKRLAAEAASLAREVGGAARDLSRAVAAGTAGYGPLAEGTAAEASQASGGTAMPARLAQGSERDQAFRALHAIGNDARTAVAQAKGLIALAAQMARARRKAVDVEDDESFFRRLQDMADEALAEVDAGQREALGELFLPAEFGSGAVTASTLSVSTTTVTVAATQFVEFA